MIQQFSRLALSSQDYLFSQIGDSQIPSQFHESPEIEKLDCIIIQNFKSFDKKYVGPFLNFTCIIGPNGSGKSNILEALMFCFCSQNSRHTLLDARQLINRQGKQSFKQLSKQNKVCSVEATFILKNGQKFVIKRTLDAEGKQQYFINFKNVNKRMYQNILLRKGINSNTPNYAIWQGQIDRLLLKDPLQLTTLLQNICGSIYLKKNYEEIKQKLQNIQVVIEQRTRKINKLKVDRKNMKAMKHTSQQYNKYDVQYQEVVKKIYLLQILEKQRGIKQLVDEIQKKQEQEKKKIQDINELKANAQRDYSKRLQLQDQLNKAMNQLAQSFSQLKNVNNPANVLKFQRLKQFEQEIVQKENQMQYLSQKRRLLQKNMPDIPPSGLIQQYLGLYQQWQSQNSALHRQISKKKNQLLFVQGVIQSKADLIKQFEQKKQKHKQKKQQKLKVIQNLKQDLRALTESIKTMESQSNKVHDKMEKGKDQYQRKNQSFQDLCQAIQDLQNMISEQAQDQKQAQMLKNLANVDGFHGALYQKIKPNNNKYDVCFSIIFGGTGKYLLCQNEECSRKIGDRLKEIRMMKNVIILDNVIEKRTNDIRKNLGRDGLMAIDIVDFDTNTKSLKQFLGQFLHGKVVCQNIAAAYKIRGKNIEGVKQIYTLDGNVIRKDGTISTHGNPEVLKKTHKYSNNKTSIYQELSKLNKQKVTVQTELRNLKIKFDEKQIIKRNLQIDQMHRKKQSINSKLKQLETQQEKQIVLPSSVSSQIKQLQKQREKINKALIELQKMIRNSKIFDKFIQKHRIQNFQTFRNANNFDHIEKLMKKKNQSQRQIANIEISLQKMKKDLQRTKHQANKLDEELKLISQLKDRTKVERNIAEKQKEIIEIRNKISKLANINRSQLVFQSGLPALEAKLIYAKQKIAKDLEDLAYELGVQYRYPVPNEQINKQLNLPRRVTDKTLQSLAEKLEEQRQKIQGHLDKHNSINLLMNIQEDEEKIQKGMNQLIDEIDQAIKDRKKLTEELENMRKDRASILINFVNRLKQYLNESYSILTEQEDNSKGSVNLHIESQDEPFQHGIYFTPTPPTKRFVYDLEQLSGGERSIASLALQYSITLASKSPILILDQTDAFLDLGNVSRFLKLINNSLRNQKVQLIIVTHKQNLFCESESLVGVSRPKELNTSQVYSLKLTD